MNTVDALNVLGKALCGDSFEVKPGLTDAETILEIAKNYEGGGSGGGDGGYSPRIIDIRSLSLNATMDYEPGLELADFVGAWLLISEGGSDGMVAVTLAGMDNSSVMMMAPIAGQSMVTLVYSPEGEIAKV